MRVLSILSVFLLVSAFSTAQVEPAPEDKAVIYFMRPSGTGALINFTFFDGEKPIARINGGKYVRYECAPGDHLFWARSENKSYIEANVEAGKIYLIEAVPTMGAVKAAVKLVPIDKKRMKLKRFQKLATRKAPEDANKYHVSTLEYEMETVIAKGLDRYDKLKKNNKTIPKLSSNMTIEPSDLVFVKKKKGR